VVFLAALSSSIIAGSQSFTKLIWLDFFMNFQPTEEQQLNRVLP
jgi:hypothetical protein